MNVIVGVCVNLVVLCALYVRMPVTAGEDRQQRVGAAVVAGSAAGALTTFVLNGWIA